MLNLKFTKSTLDVVCSQEAGPTCVSILSILYILVTLRCRLFSVSLLWLLWLGIFRPSAQLRLLEKGKSFRDDKSAV